MLAGDIMGEITFDKILLRLENASFNLISVSFYRKLKVTFLDPAPAGSLHLMLSVRDFWSPNQTFTSANILLSKF